MPKHVLSITHNALRFWQWCGGPNQLLFHPASQQSITNTHVLLKVFRYFDGGDIASVATFHMPIIFRLPKWRVNFLWLAFSSLTRSLLHVKKTKKPASLCVSWISVSVFCMSASSLNVFFLHWTLAAKQNGLWGRQRRGRRRLRRRRVVVLVVVVKVLWSSAAVCQGQ